MCFFFFRKGIVSIFIKERIASRIRFVLRVGSGTGARAPHNDGPTIVPPESMKRIGNRRPKSIRLHNEMEVREEKTTITCGFCKQPSHNRRSYKNRNQVK